MGLFGKKKEINGASDIIPNAPAMFSNQQDMGRIDPMQQSNYYAQQPNYYNEDQQMRQPDMTDINKMQPYMEPDMNRMQQPMQDSNYAPYPDQGMNDAMNFSTPQFQQPPPMQEGTKERVEEIAEAIIDEKWNEFIKEINKVIEWKERTDTEIKKMEQEIINLKERFESLHRGILGKITEYDQNLTNVGTEIKAMEKVFQNILPTFTENVNKLERIIKNGGAKDKGV